MLYSNADLPLPVSTKTYSQALDNTVGEATLTGVLVLDRMARRKSKPELTVINTQSIDFDRITPTDELLAAAWDHFAANPVPTDELAERLAEAWITDAVIEHECGIRD